MEKVEITDTIKFIGVNDRDIRLFESQYVVPNGMSYNSYIINDEKIVIMDTVDKRATDEWVKNLESELAGRKPDYLVISHLEPDHAYNIKLVADKYPNMKLIGNITTFRMLPQFFNIEELEGRQVIVKEGRNKHWKTYFTIFYGSYGTLARSYGHIRQIR